VISGENIVKFTQTTTKKILENWVFSNKIRKIGQIDSTGEKNKK